MRALTRLPAHTSLPKRRCEYGCECSCPPIFAFLTRLRFVASTLVQETSVSALNKAVCWRCSCSSQILNPQLLSLTGARKNLSWRCIPCRCRGSVSSNRCVCVCVCFFCVCVCICLCLSSQVDGLEWSFGGMTSRPPRASSLQPEACTTSGQHQQSTASNLAPTRITPIEERPFA